MWQRSGKELAVFKMSTLGAQEVLWSSWKLFDQRERFYLQKMRPWCVTSR